jgi:RNA polymerase sigma-70 factor (ECF subfamily)
MGEMMVAILSKRSKTDRSEEADLVRRMRRGDEEALELFYDTYFPRLYRYIYYRVSRDHQHTEEVVHDTFMEAIEKADRYDPGRGSVESWLITLSRNRIRSNNAAMARPKEYEQSWSMVDGELETLFADLDEGNLPEAALEREELRDLVGTTMSSLPENYSRLLEMKYTLNLPVREIARTLHKTEKAVESQLTRARVAFREAFAVLAEGMPASHR